MSALFTLSAAFVALSNALLPENAEIIARLNAEQPLATFIANEFADITPSEFASTRLLNMDPSQMLSDLSNAKHYMNAPQDIPASFDWRTKNVVTPVKNQESCGTCWAFSTTGNIEGQWALNNHTLTGLSEEFLVDCDGNDCGMFGGWPYDAYEFIISSNGIPSESLYPYCCGTKTTCYPCMAKGYNKTMCGDHDSIYCNKTRYNDLCPSTDWKEAADIKDWMAISSNEDQIAQSLYAIGPLSVCMNAQELNFYHSGIYDPSHCDPTALDHAVLLVGYGTDETSNTPYWIVKNSWGESWGENGYFRILRGQGKCGINTAVTTSCIGTCQT